MQDDRLEQVLGTLDQGLENAIGRLREFVAIPSISTDPAYAGDVRRAAEWLAAELADIGFDASVHDTDGHPMVVAHSPPSSGRSYLFYGHYDVQPVDPLELWDAPPFEMTLEEGAEGRVMRGRGTSDDKGQLMTFVEAFRAWKEVYGALPEGIVILAEGEEESGSPSLVPFLEANRDLLRADLAMICDTTLYSDGRPAITTQLRGMLTQEITVRGADRDLHSGSFGGLAANPIQILCNALGALKDDKGRVTLEGFYDGVGDLPEPLAQDWDALDFDAEAFLGEVGLRHPIGEEGRRPLEMAWARPTAEINGITGGYTGEGFKTVLPAEARAKVSFRLTGTQDPDRIDKSFQAHMRRFVPEDCEISFRRYGSDPASVMDVSDPAFGLARTALAEEWGREAAFIGSGGSIPVAGYFQNILGIDSMLIGFARDDDRIHSPNEKYDVESFAKGARSWARIVAALQE